MPQRTIAAAFLLTATLPFGTARAADVGAAGYTVALLPLPGGGEDGIAMDYIALDARTGRLWVPAGNTAAVDVVDIATGTVKQIAGFPTAVVEGRGGKRVVGPSAVTVGEGMVYIGNRGDSSVCAVDPATLQRGACTHLDAMPDGLAYVAPSHEVWATTPRDRSVRVLDARTLAQKARIAFDGQPEGFAVDLSRHRFYTNLEDKDRTLAIDLGTHATVATWASGCGEEGPRGLRVDESSGLVFVACTARVEALDGAHGGKVLSSLDTGEGVDDFDYVPAARLLYVGAARAAQLTVARVDGEGRLTATARVPTREGARNGVVTPEGKVYLAHTAASRRSDLVVVSPGAR